MKHFLITRFNVPFEDFSRDKTGVETLGDDWLAHRFELFEKICLPSVKNQSNQDFIWLIYFGAQTTSVFRDRIAKHQSDYANIKPIYVKDMDEFYSSLVKDISPHLVPSDEELITSRMDNDDLIHRDFIKTIQSLAKAKGKYLIDLTKGYQMNIEGKVDVVSKQYNPFVSLKEHASSFETVMAQKHGKWRGLVDRTKYKKEKLWVQIIHDKNVHNHFKKRLFFQKKIHLPDFGIESLPNLSS